MHKKQKKTDASTCRHLTKMKNPYGGANAVLNSAVATTCTNSNRGQIGVAADGTNVKVTACTAAADGSVTNFYSEVIALD